jgi:quinol monooxygenase YgiN
MAFIQIIESRTKKFDEVQKATEEFFAATEGKRTVARSIVTTDRNDPDHHMVIVFFDSYEEAMKNSNLPETGAFSEKLMGLLDGPPTFYDLDVVEERS